MFLVEARAGACSVSTGNPCPGPDGDGNCAESCNETADDCSAADPNGSACDDGAFCNGTETCTAGVCGSSTGDPCAGGPQCANVCDEFSNTCIVADGTPCDDGTWCTDPDVCSGGACVAAGSPCGSSATCTDTCNEAEQVCKSCGEPFSSVSCVPNALVALQTAVALRSCEPCLCDVNGSGTVTVTDSLRIVSYCIGLSVAPDQCPEIGSLLGYQTTTTTQPAIASTSTTTTLP